MKVKLLVLLLLLIPTQVYSASTWESYSDEARTVVCNEFSSKGYVYMKGTGLKSGKSYTARYYDASMVGIASETGVAQNKEFLSMIRTNTSSIAVPGEWTCELYDWNNALVQTDTFAVLGSAIPEFPNLVSKIVAPLICGLVYLRLRRKL